MVLLNPTIKMDNLYAHIEEQIDKNKYEHPLSILIPIQRGMYWNYGLYQDDDKKIEVCKHFEQEGYSCRIGMQIYWANSIGMQNGFLELSKEVKFTHRLAKDYHKELIQGEN